MVLPAADAAEPGSASRTAEPVPVLLLDQLAFLLLRLLGFSEQLQGTRKRLCGTTHPGSPITYFRARGGLTLLLRSDLDTLPCCITKSCRADWHHEGPSLLVKMSVLEHSGSFLGGLPDGAMEGSISASRLRHQTVLCSSNYKSLPESMGLWAVLIAQRLVRLRCACNASLQVLPPPISRITGVTMHPEDFLTKFPWLARVSLFLKSKGCSTPGFEPGTFRSADGDSTAAPLRRGQGLGVISISIALLCRR